MIDTTFVGIDGLLLSATVQEAKDPIGGVVLAHGANADRDEDGLYVDFAERLSDVGLASIRFDLRGHGASAGTRADVSPCQVVEDIAAAGAALQEWCPSWIAYAGASYSGGIAAGAAHTFRPQALVLFYPILDYYRRYAEDAPYWAGGGLTPEAKEALGSGEALDFFGRLLVTRASLSEFRAVTALARDGPPVPSLAFHGSDDSRAPIELARKWAAAAACRELVEYRNREHELAVPGDTELEDERSLAQRRAATHRAATWLHGLASSPPAR